MMRFLLFAVPLLASMSAAYAHSWYSEKRDPVTGGGCCGGHDCEILTITPGVLEAVEDGYHIRLTAEQAKRINPSRNVPVDTVIPWDRVQPSEDGNWHICLPTYPVGSMNRDFFCFFAPPDT
jgi:hypothetical protein